ncbi:hypothetical protein E2C01_037100 [Portunus trituberculatus]|uniref:Uncharacterized protein n=1 Tax=Portunus trituberculatus TaxID=210409 RepID=A0A5B7FAH7_PORTR|nr:hypothetical protein [Portunus trituberculatus]
MRRNTIRPPSPSYYAPDLELALRVSTLLLRPAKRRRYMTAASGNTLGLAPLTSLACSEHNGYTCLAELR